MTNGRPKFEFRVPCEVAFREKKMHFGNGQGGQFCLKCNKNTVCKLTVTFLSVKPAHNLYLTLTQCFGCLNPTITKFENVGVTKLDIVLQD